VTADATISKGHDINPFTRRWITRQQKKWFCPMVMLPLKKNILGLDFKYSFKFRIEQQTDNRYELR